MPIAYIRPINPPGQLALVEIIALSPGSPPDRPTPGPTPPGGPVDPGYSPPWAQLPVDPGYGIPEGGYPPRPTHPIFLPGMPGWPEAPPPGTGEATPIKAVVFPLPEGTPAPTPPEGLPSGSVPVLLYFGPGTKAALAWVQPYASTGPIEPPAPA